MQNDDFTEISSEEDIDSHIFELYTCSKSDDNQNLGFIDSKSRYLTITIDDEEEYTVEQSPALLTSNSLASTTGYVAWKTSTHFASWFLHHRPAGIFSQGLSDVQVLELGSGTSGLLASCLGKRVKHFIASDQAALVKALKKNIVTNVPNAESNTIDEFKGSSKRKQAVLPRIDVMQLDWENPGMHEVTEMGFAADLVIACDCIYNEFLIPHFLETLTQVAHVDHTTILIAIHLRDFEIVESFLKKTIASGFFRIWYIDEQYLTEELRNGFVIYYIKKVV